PEGRDGGRDGLPKGIAALHGRLRRQVGVDVDRQHRARMAEVRQRNADGVIDLGGRGEGRIEILPVKLAHQLEGDLARYLPMELPTRKFAGRFASHMDGEGWGRGVKELLSMIVGEDDP